ncbi:MAG: DUF5063 domain-containing protein [Candidatus Acidiferrales bacterium]|jgi:hypothetical protein
MIDNSNSALNRFRVAAEAFIEAVDSAPTVKRDAFLSSINHCLAELYSSALRLPAVAPDTSQVDETPSVKREWEGLFLSLREKIGPLDGYWNVFDSTTKSTTVQGSLSIDISEIYSDIKQGFRLEVVGVPEADFLWDLRFSFRSHWGRHALGALTAIHDRHVE